MVQVIEQTREEKMAMYMAIEKDKLCEMLIECNRIIDMLTPIVIAGPLHNPIMEKAHYSKIIDINT